MADKNLFKKDYKSKKAVTKCGYCSQDIKEENLENHCKTVHKKPKLAAGQRTLDSLFKPTRVNVDPIPDETLPAAEIDVAPPPAKKAKVTAEEITHDNFDDFLEPKIDDKNNNIVAFVSADFSSVPSKIEEMSKTLSAMKSSIDSLQSSQLPKPVEENEFAVPAPIDDRIDKLILCK